MVAVLRPKQTDGALAFAFGFVTCGATPAIRRSIGHCRAGTFLVAGIRDVSAPGLGLTTGNFLSISTDVFRTQGFVRARLAGGAAVAGGVLIGTKGFAAFGLALLAAIAAVTFAAGSTVFEKGALVIILGKE